MALMVKWISETVRTRGTRWLLLAEVAVTVPPAAFRCLLCVLSIVAFPPPIQWLAASSGTIWLKRQRHGLRGACLPDGLDGVVTEVKGWLLRGSCGPHRPAVTCSQLSRWKARELEVGGRLWCQKEEVGRLSPVMTKSAIIVGSHQQILVMISHCKQLKSKPWI